VLCSAGPSCFLGVSRVQSGVFATGVTGAVESSSDRHCAFF
jgi:hypothetical protein